MAAYVLSSSASQEPITLEEAKQHLRIDIDDDNLIIDSLISVAREYAEAVTGRALITQTWKAYLEDWPSDKDYIELPFPPLQSVSSITYTNSDLTINTWSTSYWETSTQCEPGRVNLSYGESWPTATLNVGLPICITFVAGYGTPDDVPDLIKAGMKVDLMDLYDNRASIVIGQAINHLATVDRLYFPKRVFKF
jgi:uncharacterized phiE125 gp8 family phage protein